MSLRLTALAALSLAVGLLVAAGCGPGDPDREAPRGTTGSTGVTPPKDEVERQDGGPKRGTAAGSLLGRDALKSFESLAASMAADVGVAVAPLGDGPVQTLGSLQGGHAWSTIKVPILVTLMRDRDGALTAEERMWAADALEASSNEAAASLFDELEEIHGGLEGASAAVERTLAAAGDDETTVATTPPPPGAVSTYGQTEWSLEASVRFFRSLANGCLLDGGGTEFVLELMAGVIPEQRWGMGEAGFDPGWELGFKGGWGPEAGSGSYLVRQVGVLRRGDAGVAMAIVVEDDSGSFEAGVADLTRLARWLRENLSGLGPPAADC